MKISMALEFNLGYVNISDLCMESGYPEYYIGILNGMWVHNTDDRKGIFYMSHVDYLPTPCTDKPAFTVFTASGKIRIACDAEDQGVVVKCPNAGFYDIHLFITSPYVITGITINLRKKTKQVNDDTL